jgi:hypothetical protein
MRNIVGEQKPVVKQAPRLASACLCPCGGYIIAGVTIRPGALRNVRILRMIAYPEIGERIWAIPNNSQKYVGIYLLLGIAGR